MTTTTLKTLLAEAPPASALVPGAFWLLDGLGAVLFALALSQALAALPDFGADAWFWLATLAVAGALRAAAGWGGAWSGARRARTLKRFLRDRMMGAALAARPGQAAAIGTRVTAVVDEVEALDGWFARFEPLRLAATVTPLMIVAAAAVASPISAAILLGTLVPFALVMALAGGAAAEAARRQFDALARLSGLFVDRVRALPVILAFQAEAAQATQVETAARGVARRTLAVLKLAFVSSAGLEFFAALSVALVAVYAGFNLLGLLPIDVPEQLDLQRAVFVLVLAPEFYAPMRRLAAAYHDKQMGLAAGERLAGLMAMPAIPASAGVGPARAPEIVFRGVTVRYQDNPCLGPFDFTAPAGKITMLLGASGSGKSTLLSLLVGAAPLGSGDVLVDGEPLSQARSFAPAVAWAGQSPILAPGSIGENIRLGRPDADMSEVEAAARRVGLAPALAARPAGLATLVDERGSGLSGGERRRIGLARAWLKPAPILVLDEPTADLDGIAETEIVAIIRGMAGPRTVLIATHSERVAAIADKLVRLP